ncbi:2,4-dihydroxyhept-2-ene-1,7-dioic acid aldolase [Azorhizobium oxalatiphilum]|uniref:2,4-dihydroxyhept-2-ene-1,7-dioic acid aldolase n=1 Tax=Azorhizobium oxalatiphilum TaxID=980631 RepID=A0A917CA67_9HYPH|nr:HpcH/HpaI aldolase/citrate lyase family protein [Azorhizobium oxalatiphilum]GGF78699.1 2,4-dihydroxyhept-2-ene-1,7-dioic acid aldolase [Azorhizobium oxalatiphilum]
MDLPQNPFKRAIYAGQQQIGFWNSMVSTTATEILAGSGFDWLLIDAEHAPNEPASLMAQLQAMMENTTHPVVRVPENDPIVLKRCLDIGTQTFLIPMVETVEQAEAAVAATRFPPNGIRGFAGASRASRYGRVANYHARAHEEICILVQIETMQGLDNLEAIAAVPGIDGLFIGPGDLSADMGHLGNQGHDDVVALIEKTIKRIVAAGNRAGILTPDETLARRYMAAGCVYTAVGIDTGLLARQTEAIARKYKA